MASLPSGYLKKLIMVTVLSAIIAGLLYFIGLKPWISKAFPYMLVFFFSASIISFKVMQISLSKRFGRFVSAFMLTTLVKLLVYISVLVVFSLTHPAEAVAFIINFFILYLIFTIFEVAGIIGQTGKTGPGENTGS